MKVAFYTLGCKVNQYETRLLEERFIQNGYEVVEFEKFSDIYVINSCSVTNMSDRKSRQIIAKARKENDKSIIVITGCYAEAINQEISGADIVVSNSKKENIVDIVDNYIKENSEKKDKKSKIKNTKSIEYIRFGEDISKEKVYHQAKILQKGKEVREYVKIEDGCDNFCAYCIIPYLRGRVRSRDITDIEKEVKNLVKNGVKEIVLVGIEIASYGKDLENITLIDVVKKVNDIDGVQRIRLGSLEPRILTKENIQILKNVDKLCPHFHLSLQSGSNSVLKKMNRKYKTEEFLQTVKLLRDNFNDVALTTDIIVGFPGETENEFKETYEFLKLVKFKEVHVFKYSKRKNTVADKMDNQIDGNIKSKRSKLLLELSKDLNKEYIKDYIGKELEVLYEEETDDEKIGYTKNYIKVKRKKGAKTCQERGMQENVIVSLEDLNYNL